MTNDVCGGMMTALVPYLVLDGLISTTLAGLVLLVYLIGSSLLQPLFGLASDQSGRRMFAIFGPLIVGVGAAAMGWATNAAVVFAIVAVGGVGTAAFHPQAASMVDRLATRNKGWSMSIFSMGGNVGFALGPLSAATVATIGLHWSPVILILCLGVCGAMFRFAPAMPPSGAQMDVGDLRAIMRRAWIPLALIVAVIATRSAVQYGMILFLPLFYHARGFPPELGSYYAFVISLFGAFGGLLGGRLSDRYGRKIVVATTLLVACPLLYAALIVSGFWVWPLLALSGAALVASNSVTVVQGQEWLPANTGIASGITMGVGFGLSGVLASSMSALADHVGVGTVVYLVPLLAWLAAGFAILIPRAPVRLQGSNSAVPPVAATSYGAG